jgi:hypothetical protein
MYFHRALRGDVLNLPFFALASKDMALSFAD